MAPDDTSGPESTDGSGSENEVEAVSVRHTLSGVGQGQLIQQTTFDEYFTQTARSARTSANVFSSLVPPLSREEFRAFFPPTLRTTGNSKVFHDTQFPRFMAEMDEGFNLILFGLGSKRAELNRFAFEHCAKRGHVVVCNAFRPDFALKTLLASVERVPGLTERALATAGPESQARRICAFFDTHRHPLYVIIHNIDAPSLRTAKAKSCLSHLALHLNIHIAASVDHINAPLLFTTSESSTRKQSAGASATDAPPRGYAWLWHDITTCASYSAELAFADPSSISGASSGGPRAAKAAAAGGAHAHMVAITETAAAHILASVTQKAKKLFAMMAAKQLELVRDAGDAGTGAGDLQQFAVGYDALFNTARDNFVATTDGALRSLLGEFRDHGLVVSSTGGGAGAREMLWIPMRSERLVKVVKSLEAE